MEQLPKKDRRFGRLKQDEALSLTLRGIYEQFGYKRTYVNRFEPYDLYVDNKNFLNCEQIISFMDLDGRLLALKPDVTLSIVKRLPDSGPEGLEKLYYHEKVYRLPAGGREYKEINQTGIELFGDIDGFCRVEAVALALSSLSAISERSLLGVSHMGFVAGLLDEAAVDPSVKREINRQIHAKNTHDLKRLLAPLAAPESWKARVAQLPLLYGPFAQTLERARSIASGGQMEQALCELAALYQAFENTADAERLCLDFSIVNDLDYYNGLIFQGYVEGLSKIVLTGGSYDNLTAKLGKRCGAIGFAVYMDELARLYPPAPAPDWDAVILYDDQTQEAALLETMRRMQAEGKTVRAVRAGGALDGTGKACYRFLNGACVPVEPEDSLKREGK